jgi:hypothetical protein
MLQQDVRLASRRELVSLMAMVAGLGVHVISVALVMDGRFWYRLMAASQPSKVRLPSAQTQHTRPSSYPEGM